MFCPWYVGNIVLCFVFKSSKWGQFVHSEQADEDVDSDSEEDGGSYVTQYNMSHRGNKHKR